MQISRNLIEMYTFAFSALNLIYPENLCFFLSWALIARANVVMKIAL